MPRPLTRNQIIQNAAFLRELLNCGNVRLAARTVGVAYGTIQHRRAQHPAFAQRWDATLAFVQARLAEQGRRGPVAARAAADPLRTVGGEPVVVRRNDGKLQVRAAQPGKLTAQCLQHFLSALAATANVRLSAAAAGASVAAFQRRRQQDVAFAREWRLALAQGYDRIELALLESALPEGFEHDDWRRNDPRAIPPLTANQALQLLYLHQKEVRLNGEHPALRRRPGESEAVRQTRLELIYEQRREREREKFRIAEAERLARGEPTQQRWAPGELPDLSQVTGWSTARRDAVVADPTVALFGGRRFGWRGG